MNTIYSELLTATRLIPVTEGFQNSIKVSWNFLLIEKNTTNSPISNLDVGNGRFYFPVFRSPRLHKTFKVFAFALLLTFTLLLPNLTQAGITGPGSGWQYYRKISLSAATPAADFQVKVTLTAGQYANMNASGNDLRFYDINNNACNYWIETWNTGGTSTIWVKIPASAATAVYMFYGNPAAVAASNGNTTFDFFDDFLGTSLNANWTTILTNGIVNVSGGIVTVTNTGGVTNDNTGGAGLYSAFTPQSNSFIIEAKHNEGAINRNRFYALDASNPSGNGGSNSVIGLDYGFFLVGTTQVYWNATTGIAVSAGTNYLTRWDITDGTNTTYKWSNYLYTTGAQISTNSTTLTKTIRYLTFRVTEQAATSTSVDWARVRKAGATEPLGTAGTQLAVVAASITSQTNVLCNGQATGSATVTATGGVTPYTYSWTTIPVQTTQTAINLSAGAYTVNATDANGILGSATANITLAAVVIATATGNNITCNAASDGTITISATGGTGTYLFSVDDGATYKPDDMIPVSPPYVYGGLIANHAYRIKVKDTNGCISK